MTENNDYTKEIYFNMGMEFYNLLANIKKMIMVFYADENFEKVIDFLQEEYIHIAPFLKKTDKDDDRIQNVELCLKKMENYILQPRIFRKYYLQVKSLLSSLEADNGMLQPYNFKMDQSIPFAVRNK